MKKIKFMKDWNNKLALDYFTTIRLGTVENVKYYQESVGNEFGVVLKGKEVQQANLITATTYKLNQIPHYLCYLDAGLKFLDFVELMKGFYSKKPEWDELNTPIIVLVFRTTTRIKFR